MERTPDGRYVVIHGRRWRATDPELPEEVAARLRRQLMSARRAVRTALRAGDPVAERAARDRVQRAKTALGERGTPWWEQTSAERQERWQAGLDDDEPEPASPERDPRSAPSPKAIAFTPCPTAVR